MMYICFRGCLLLLPYIDFVAKNLCVSNNIRSQLIREFGIVIKHFVVIDDVCNDISTTFIVHFYCIAMTLATTILLPYVVLQGNLTTFTMKVTLPYFFLKQIIMSFTTNIIITIKLAMAEFVTTESCYNDSVICNEYTS